VTNDGLDSTCTEISKTHSVLKFSLTTRFLELVANWPPKLKSHFDPWKYVCLSIFFFIFKQFIQATLITLVVMLGTRFKIWSPKTKFGCPGNHFRRQN
jgi:hypothetical protein